MASVRCSARTGPTARVNGHPRLTTRTTRRLVSSSSRLRRTIRSWPTAFWFRRSGFSLPVGQRTHHRQSAPIASWLYALGMAVSLVHHAGTVRGVPLQSWVFPQDQEVGYRLFETTTRQAVEFFSDHIGSYPYDKDRQRAGRWNRRRYRACNRHLLRREGRGFGQRGRRDMKWRTSGGGMPSPRAIGTMCG